jgi:hypothetical protein
MGVQLRCDWTYCFREFDATDADAKDWRAVEVKTDQDDTHADVVIDAYALNLESVDASHAIACPQHWRQVARDIAKHLELFPDPPVPEREPLAVVPPAPAPAEGGSDMPF